MPRNISKGSVRKCICSDSRSSSRCAGSAKDLGKAVGGLEDSEPKNSATAAGGGAVVQKPTAGKSRTKSVRHASTNVAARVSRRLSANPFGTALPLGAPGAPSKQRDTFRLFPASKRPSGSCTPTRGSDNVSQTGCGVGSQGGGTSKLFNVRTSDAAAHAQLSRYLSIKSNTDSDMASEEANNHPVRKWYDVMLPSHPFFTVWSKIIAISVAYVAVAIPMQAAFDEQLQSRGMSWFVINLFVDALFILDVAVVFNTALKKQGIWEYDRKQIAERYIRTDFTLDVVAAFPYALLVT
eukprot:7387183-Prymnesium_polylepis.1